MPKVKDCHGAVLRRCVATDPEAFSTDGKILFCKLCEKEIPVKKMFQCEQHKATAMHKKKVEKNNEKKKQGENGKKQALIVPVVSKSNQQDEFHSRVCQAFLKANIPLYKLEHESIRKLFHDYCSKDLPHEWTLRKKFVTAEYEKVIQHIRCEIGNNPIWISIDETTDSCGRYIANVIVGKLSSSEPGRGRLIVCKELEETNHSTIVRTVQRALYLLWPNAEEIDENKVLALVTDAAPYMVKAGKTLKELYPKMIHVTCLAHAVHRVAEALREQCPSVNKLISSGKKIFVKAPSRIRAFREKHPELALPPEPILTRWGTWVLAALYYADNLEAVKEVVNMFDESDSQYIAKAKKSMASTETKAQLTFIKAYMDSIPQLISKLEYSEKELIQVVDEMKKFEDRATSWPGSIGTSVRNKLEYVLSRNPAWKTIIDISRSLKGETPETPLSYTANELSNFKYLPLVSVDVERSFSRMKQLLTDLRHSFKTENLEKHLIVQVNGFDD